MNKEELIKLMPPKDISKYNNVLSVSDATGYNRAIEEIAETLAPLVCKRLDKERLITIMDKVCQKLKGGTSAQLKFYILEFAEAIEKELER